MMCNLCHSLHNTFIDRTFYCLPVDASYRLERLYKVKQQISNVGYISLRYSSYRIDVMMKINAGVGIQFALSNKVKGWRRVFKSVWCSGYGYWIFSWVRRLVLRLRFDLHF